MILAFVGVSLALYGGAVLAGVVAAYHRPLLWLAMTGEPLDENLRRGGAVAAAVLMGCGYGALTGGLSGIV